MLLGISVDFPPLDSLHKIYQQAHMWSDHISVYFVSMFPSMFLNGSDSPLQYRVLSMVEVKMTKEYDTFWFDLVSWTAGIG